MNKKDYINNIEKFYKQNVDISKKKMNDYTGENPFDNFLLASMTGATVEQGLLIRIGDKFSRACNLIGKGTKQEVSDESVIDTLADMANYCAILATYLKK